MPPDDYILNQYLATIDRRLERIENALVGHKTKVAALSSSFAIVTSLVISLVLR